MYSTERVVAKFEKLVGRTSLQQIQSSDELLSTAIANIANIETPKQLVASDVHCKSCDD